MSIEKWKSSLRRRPSKVAPHKTIVTQPGKGQQNTKDNASNNASTQYLNHNEIQQKAIQVFYTEGMDRRADFVHSHSKTEYFKVIHPNGTFRRVFDLFTVVWVLLLVFFIPFQIGFDWYIEPKAQKIFLAILDIWFGIDILLNFRTGYIYHGTIVMSPKKITTHYLSTWFLVDMLGTFPFERIIEGDATSRKSLKLIKYFKIPKLMRIGRVLKYVRDHKFVYDLFQVFVLVLTFLHLGACFWMLILNPCGTSDLELNSTDTCAQENVFNIYIESFHLSAAMVLGISNYHIIGESSTLDMLTERRESDRIRMYVISTLYMVGGLFLVALLIGETSVYLMGKMQGSAAFQRKIDRVTHEMEYYGVPDDLQLQVKAFYDYIWIHQKQYDDKVALLSDDQMSTDLQRKLALHLFKDVVSHISIFSDIDDTLLGEICLSLRTKIFLPDDMILFKDDVGKELFIIGKGVVEVLRDDLPLTQRKSNPPILLRNGSFFGEIALIMEIRRTCSVQAKTVCEVNILQQQTFDTILMENPDFARRMNELVVARQLERSLTKSASPGADIRVSKIDIDNAISAVEHNMKQGLERRMKRDHEAHDSSFKDSDDLIRLPSVPNDNRSQDIQHGIKISLSNDDCPTLKGSTQNQNDTEQMDVDKMINDITRRSTRRPPENCSRNNGVVENERLPPTKNYTSNSDTTKQSKGKSIVRNSRHCDGEGTNDTSAQTFDYITIEDGEGEDAETMLITGHFNPNRVKININKVHPSILNSGHRNNTLHSAQPEELEALQRFEKRIIRQDMLMKDLLSKVDRLIDSNHKEDHVKKS